VVLVHGFTQSGRSFAPLAAALAPATGHGQTSSAIEAVAVELPGHGNAPVLAPGEGLAEAASLLARSGGRATYVGYSMGGRVCLRLALDRPDLVEALVLVGATPGIEDLAERAARRAADDALAARIETVALSDFLAEWLAGPLFEHLSADQADLPARLVNRPESLAATLRALGTGAEQPMWSRLVELGEHQIPVLLVTGEGDAKFTGIATRMATLIGPRAELALVHGAGHGVPSERPRELADLIRAFAGLTTRSRG
jgi:2-succinyl-6-hydroxy-2,4-cyclohexadiene-1-carboxylate synthase